LEDDLNKGMKLMDEADGGREVREKDKKLMSKGKIRTQFIDFPK
jgi:hypothetical protein